MGEKHQVSRAKPRRAPARSRRAVADNVVDLATWKRRRASEEAGKYGLGPIARQLRRRGDTGGTTA